MKKVWYVCMAALLIWLEPVCAQSKQGTTEGTDFWITWLNNNGQNSSAEDLILSLEFASRDDNDIVIVYGSGPTFVTKHISANSGLVYSFIPKSDNPQLMPKEYTKEDGAQDLCAVRVYSVQNTPFSVVAKSSFKDGHDAARILPYEALGHDYVIGTWNSESQATEFALVAPEEMDVAIKFSGNTNKHNKSTSSETIHLKPRQVVIFSSKKAETTEDGVISDLSGTTICASKPIAVFEGNMSPKIPEVSGDYTSGHAYNQLTPVAHQTGTDYFIPRVPGTKMNKVLIVSSTNNAMVKYYWSASNNVSTTMNIGDTLTLTLDDTHPYVGISSTNAIQVQLLTSSAQLNWVSNVQMGNPASTLIPSFDRSLNTANIYIPDGETETKGNAVTHYLTLFSKSSTAPTILKDGTTAVSITMSNTTVNNKYYYGQVALQPGYYTISGTGFLGYITGMQRGYAYLYPVGEGYTYYNYLYLTQYQNTACEDCQPKVYFGDQSDMPILLKDNFYREKADNLRSGWEKRKKLKDAQIYYDSIVICDSSRLTFEQRVPMASIQSYKWRLWEGQANKNAKFTPVGTTPLEEVTGTGNPYSHQFILSTDCATKPKTYKDIPNWRDYLLELTIERTPTGPVCTDCDVMNENGYIEETTHVLIRVHKEYNDTIWRVVENNGAFTEFSEVTNGVKTGKKTYFYLNGDATSANYYATHQDQYAEAEVYNFGVKNYTRQYQSVVAGCDSLSTLRLLALRSGRDTTTFTVCENELNTVSTHGVWGFENYDWEKTIHKDPNYTAGQQGLHTYVYSKTHSASSEQRNINYGGLSKSVVDQFISEMRSHGVKPANFYGFDSTYIVKLNVIQAQSIVHDTMHLCGYDDQSWANATSSQYRTLPVAEWWANRNTPQGFNKNADGVWEYYLEDTPVYFADYPTCPQKFATVRVFYYENRSNQTADINVCANETVVYTHPVDKGGESPLTFVGSEVANNGGTQTKTVTVAAEECDLVTFKVTVTAHLVDTTYSTMSDEVCHKTNALYMNYTDMAPEVREHFTNASTGKIDGTRIIQEQTASGISNIYFKDIKMENFTSKPLIRIFADTVTREDCDCDSIIHFTLRINPFVKDTIDTVVLTNYTWQIFGDSSLYYGENVDTAALRQQLVDTEGRVPYKTANMHRVTSFTEADVHYLSDRGCDVDKLYLMRYRHIYRESLTAYTCHNSMFAVPSNYRPAPLMNERWEVAAPTKTISSKDTTYLAEINKTTITRYGRSLEQSDSVYYHLTLNYMPLVEAESVIDECQQVGGSVVLGDRVFYLDLPKTYPAIRQVYSSEKEHNTQFVYQSPYRNDTVTATETVTCSDTLYTETLTVHPAYNKANNNSPTDIVSLCSIDTFRWVDGNGKLYVGSDFPTSGIPVADQNNYIRVNSDDQTYVEEISGTTQYGCDNNRYLQLNLQKTYVDHRYLQLPDNDDTYTFGERKATHTFDSIVRGIDIWGYENGKPIDRSDLSRPSDQGRLFIFRDTVRSTGECYDLITIDSVMVYPTYEIQDNPVTICATENYAWRCYTKLPINSMQSDFKCEYKTVMGYDSIYTITPEVILNTHDTDSVCLCKGSSYYWHGQKIEYVPGMQPTSPDGYFHKHGEIPDDQCASTFDLWYKFSDTYNYGIEDSSAVQICQYSPFHWYLPDGVTEHRYGLCDNQGRRYTSFPTHLTGEWIIYDSLLTVGCGCDSVYAIRVNITPVHKDIHRLTTCAKEPLYLNQYGRDTMYMYDGIHTQIFDTLYLSSGDDCPNIDIVVVSFIPAVDTTTTMTVCASEFEDTKWMDQSLAYWFPQLSVYNMSAPFVGKKEVPGTYNGCSFIQTLDLTVLPNNEHTYYDTICESDTASYTFRSYPLKPRWNTLKHVYICDTVLPNQWGCDEKVQIILDMHKQATVTIDSVIMACREKGATSAMAINFKIDYVYKGDGAPLSYTLVCPNIANPDAAPTIITEPLSEASGTIAISVPIPSNLDPDLTEPGKIYPASIVFRDNVCQSELDTIHFKYKMGFPPSAYVVQLWGDVLAVKIDDEQKYDFTAFQWYKNGEILKGETNSYLSVPGGFNSNDQYSIEITVSGNEGLPVSTCPFTVIDIRTDNENVAADDVLTVSPTIVDHTSPVVNITSSMSGCRCMVYSAYSTLVGMYDYPAGESGEHLLTLPSVPGVYVIRLSSESSLVRSVKVIVK